MKKYLILFSFIFCLFSLRCAPPVKVIHDYDTQYNFARLKTYKWMPNPDKKQKRSFQIRRFSNAVDNGLKEKGFELVNRQPDFLIALHGGTQTKANVTHYGYSYGPYWRGRRVAVSHYKEGTIALDFVDAKSKELIWRGVAKSVVNRSLSPEQQDVLFNKIAKQLLAKFPPKK